MKLTKHKNNILQLRGKIVCTQVRCEKYRSMQNVKMQVPYTVNNVMSQFQTLPLYKKK